ncbi:MAG: hypothetical protein ABIT38_06745 [Gemmatimonadaceae bacterium]
MSPLVPVPDYAAAWRALLLQAWPKGPQDRSAPIHIAPLRTFVCAFVRDAKARGEPSERVIRQVKSMTTRAVAELAPREHEAILLEAIFQWCLDEYYGTQGSTGAPAAVYCRPQLERR